MNVVVNVCLKVEGKTVFDATTDATTGMMTVEVGWSMRFGGLFETCLSSGGRPCGGGGSSVQFDFKMLRGLLFDQSYGRESEASSSRKGVRGELLYMEMATPIRCAAANSSQKMTCMYDDIVIQPEDKVPFLGGRGEEAVRIKCIVGDDGDQEDARTTSPTAILEIFVVDQEDKISCLALAKSLTQSLEKELDKCCVCLQPIVDIVREGKTEVVELNNCQHMLCASCVQCLNPADGCPMCRKAYTRVKVCERVHTTVKCMDALLCTHSALPWMTRGKRRREVRSPKSD
jgi:hypothetical protein